MFDMWKPWAWDVVGDGEEESRSVTDFYFYFKALTVYGKEHNLRILVARGRFPFNMALGFWAG